MKLRLRLALAPVTLAALLAAPVTARAEDWKKSFAEKFGSKNSWERASAIKGLDPNNPDQLKMLLKIAKDDEWFIRSAIAGVLSGKLEAKATDEVKKVLKAGKGGDSEVAATGMGLSKDAAWVEPLVDALQKASDWKVKRAAAEALGNIPEKKAVAGLIDGYEKEVKNFNVAIHCQLALEKVTGETDKHTPVEWKGWWQSVESSWTPPGEKKEGEEKKEDSGVVHTVSRGTNLDFRSRGKGRPMLVLPEYGYEKDYFETYLQNLEDTNRILYMDLPALDSFNPKIEPAANLPQPYYPIDRFVDSLEDLRKSLIKDGKLADKPFAILGHGISAWVAMRYASKHPEGVSRLVVLSSYASGRAFSRDLKAMEAAGKARQDVELEHYAMSLQFENGKPRYEGTSEDEHDALSRKAFTTYFANWNDIEIGRLYGPKVAKKGYSGSIPQVIRPLGGCFVPDFDLAKEPEIPTPTLVLAGDSSFFGTPQDAQEIQQHYGKSSVEIFKNCGRMPFVEDNKRFVAVMEKFLH